jgi:hypothetical protein
MGVFVASASSAVVMVSMVFAYYTCVLLVCVVVGVLLFQSFVVVRGTVMSRVYGGRVVDLVYARLGELKRS